jgi:hypothetical protein
VIFFESYTIRDLKQHVGKGYNHDSVPKVPKPAEGHYDEIFDTAILLSQPKFCFNFVVLESF